MVDGHIVAFLLNLCKLSWWLRYRPSLLLLVFSFALVKAVSCLCRHRWFYNCVEPNGREQREDGTAETQRIRPNSSLQWFHHGLCPFLLWGLQHSSGWTPSYNPAEWDTAGYGNTATHAMCQETANGEAPRNEPSNSWVPCPLTWATVGLAAWWHSGLVGVFYASVLYTPRVLSLPKR